MNFQEIIKHNNAQHYLLILFIKYYYNIFVLYRNIMKEHYYMFLIT